MEAVTKAVLAASVKCGHWSDGRQPLFQQGQQSSPMEAELRGRASARDKDESWP